MIELKKQIEFPILKIRISLIANSFSISLKALNLEPLTLN
jgi:hypothetical protein